MSKSTSPQYDPPSRIGSRLVSTTTNPIVPVSPSLSASNTSNNALATSNTNTQAKSREDSIALLSGLTDNSQLAPAIKAICDRGWTTTFTGFLDRAIQQKDNEILITCNEHFEELIFTIDHVLAAKEQAVELKGQISQLHKDLQETSRNLLNDSIELNNHRIVHQNLLITLHVLEDINTRIFVSLSLAFQQIEEKRYFIALKTLAYVQRELGRYQAFNFTKELELQIPILANLIKNIVKQEFEQWLSGLKDRGPVLGYFTMHSTHLKLWEMHKKYHYRLQDQLRLINLDLNPCYLTKHVIFATSISTRSAKRHQQQEKLQHSNHLDGTNPNSSSYNVYTLIDLQLGCKINIWDPQSPRQPFNVLLHTRPPSINQKVVERAKQMKAVAKQYGSSSSSSSTSHTSGRRRDSTDTSRSGSASKRDKSSKRTKSDRKRITVDHSESEEEIDDGSDDEFGFGIKKKTKGGRKIKKRRKRTTTTTTTHRIFKDGRWIDVPNSSSSSSGDDDDDSDDYSDDDNEGYDDLDDITTGSSSTKTTTRGGAKITTTTTTTTTTSSGGKTVTVTSGSSSKDNSGTMTLRDKRKMRANAAMASKNVSLNNLRKANSHKFDLFESLDELEDDQIDIATGLSMYTLTTMAAANISFIPLYQCLHVYQSLGQLPSFRQIYSSLRHSQATTQVRVLDSGSPYNSSGRYNHSQNVSLLLHGGHGNKPVGINPVAEYHKPKTKIQAYLPTAAALPTSLSNIDGPEQANPNPTAPESRRGSTTVSNPQALNVPNAGKPPNSISSKDSPPALARTQSQTPFSNPKHSKIVSLLQLQQLYSEIMGFFVLEESIIRTGARLLSRTELESLWERGSLRVKVVLMEYLSTITSPQDFLLVKECTMIFLTTMEHHRFNVTTLYEFLVQQLPQFKELCTQAFILELNKLSTIDRFEPLTIYSHNDYYNLVIATGLTPLDANSNDNTSSSTSPDYAGNPIPNALSPMNGFASPTVPAGPGSNMPFVPTHFPITMPFSISIPLIAIIIRTFASLLFEYAYGLLLPSGSLSMNVTTSVSLLIKELVIEFLSRHKGGSHSFYDQQYQQQFKKNQAIATSSQSAASKEQQKRERELLFNTTTVPLAVQGRMNAYYMSIFADNAIKYLNAHIQQRLGDNTPLSTQLSCMSNLEYTISSYDRFIVDILKHKVDKISYIDEFDWVSRQYCYTPSDSMLDLTTFLHTTLSCTIFLPSNIRQDVCIHTYEHIAQSIIFAFQSVPSSKDTNTTAPLITNFTQIGLYNFLHDIHEFEALSNTYQAKTYRNDVESAVLTGGFDKKTHVKMVNNNTNHMVEKRYNDGTKSAIFNAMAQHTANANKNNAQNNEKQQEVEVAVMLPTHESSMLTISFQRLRQVCLLFVENDFAAFLDPETRSVRYNLLDGIFLLRVCSKFKEVKPTATPTSNLVGDNGLPIGVKHVKKTDVDSFEFKLKKMIDAGML